MRSRTAGLILAAALCCLSVAACVEEEDVSRLELRDDMRRLWTDHVTLTRVYLIASIDELPDQDFAAERLLQNQVEIGNAIRPFYGDEAGDTLTALLQDHIAIAVEIVAAAKVGDLDAVAEANARWIANAGDIASFLADANPNWNEDTLIAMMLTHLQQTLLEATARLTGDVELELAAYEDAIEHILHMSDAISVGIATQFPDQVVVDVDLSARDENLHIVMRELWTEHTALTRNYAMSAVSELPDASEVESRLLESPLDIGDAFKPFYGDSAGGILALILTQYVTVETEVVAAARAEDTAALEDAHTRWVTSANLVATFLADANPNLDRDELAFMMRTHLEQTLLQVTARVAMDWDTDIEAYDVMVLNSNRIADHLSAGISAQFPENQGQN